MRFFSGQIEFAHSGYDLRPDRRSAAAGTGTFSFSTPPEMFIVVRFLISDFVTGYLKNRNHFMTSVIFIMCNHHPHYGLLSSCRCVVQQLQSINLVRQGLLTCLTGFVLSLLDVLLSLDVLRLCGSLSCFAPSLVCVMHLSDAYSLNLSGTRPID